MEEISCYENVRRLVVVLVPRLFQGHLAGALLRKRERAATTVTLEPCDLAAVAVGDNERREATTE